MTPCLLNVPYHSDTMRCKVLVSHTQAKDSAREFAVVASSLQWGHLLESRYSE